MQQADFGKHSINIDLREAQAYTLTFNLSVFTRSARAMGAAFASPAR